MTALLLDDVGLCQLRQLCEARDAFEVIDAYCRENNVDLRAIHEVRKDRHVREMASFNLLLEFLEHLCFLLWISENELSGLLKGDRRIDLGDEVVSLVYRFYDEGEKGLDRHLLKTGEEIARAAVQIYHAYVDA